MMISSEVLSISITIFPAILTPLTNGCFAKADPANASGSISSPQYTSIAPVKLVLSHPEKAPFLIAVISSIFITSPSFLQKVLSRVQKIFPSFRTRQFPVSNLSLSDWTHFTFGNRLFGIRISNTLLLMTRLSTFGKLFLLSGIIRS